MNTVVHGVWITARMELFKIWLNRPAWPGIGLWLGFWSFVSFLVTRYIDIFTDPGSPGFFIAQLLNQAGLLQLDRWQNPSLALMYMLLLPVMAVHAVILGADAFASERGRRGGRFYVPRCPRLVWFAGRVLGRVLGSGLAMLLVILLFSVFTLLNNEFALSAYIAELWLVMRSSLSVLLAFGLFAILVSLYSRSFTTALLWVVLSWVLLNIGLSYLPELLQSGLGWLLPGQGLKALLNIDPSNPDYAWHGAMLQSLVLLVWGGLRARRMSL